MNQNENEWDEWMTLQNVVLESTMSALVESSHKAHLVAFGSNGDMTAPSGELQAMMGRISSVIFNTPLGHASTLLYRLADRVAVADIQTAHVSEHLVNCLSRLRGALAALESQDADLNILTDIVDVIAELDLLALGECSEGAGETGG